MQLTVHCAKNLMHKSLKKIKVPLILGVWGGKGQGKTFQVTLAFKAMKADPIIMSAGELEAGNAGEPAKLVRQRYREAGTLTRSSSFTTGAPCTRVTCHQLNSYVSYALILQPSVCVLHHAPQLLSRCTCEHCCVAPFYVDGINKAYGKQPRVFR